MSRLPLEEIVAPEVVPGEMILLMETLETSPVTARQIQKDTIRDVPANAQDSDMDIARVASVTRELERRILLC